MAAVDFEKEFADFVNTTNNSSITDIYKIIPSFNNEQIKIYLVLTYYIQKYDLKPLRAFINEYASHMKTNKNLNFLSSMNLKSLLKAYTVDEQLRGIKISQNNIKEE
jgi:hypothetical protein